VYVKNAVSGAGIYPSSSAFGETGGSFEDPVV